MADICYLSFAIYVDLVNEVVGSLIREETVSVLFKNVAGEFDVSVLIKCLIRK